MADSWDVKQGLACLLKARACPEWDDDGDRDIVETLVTKHVSAASRAAAYAA